jgi:hypothetical protein
MAHRHAFDVGAHLGKLRADAYELHIDPLTKAKIPSPMLPCGRPASWATRVGRR